MCLWANYIFPLWVCLFCWRKYVDWSWEYINCSKTHECGNWGWGRAIPRKGIYKRNCRCCAWWHGVGSELSLDCRTVFSFEKAGITPDPGPVPPALPAHRYHSPRHVADAGDKDQEKHRICRICSSYFTGGGWLAEKIRKFANLKSSLDLQTFSKCGTFADFRFAVPIFFCDLPIRDLADPVFLLA